MKIMLDFLLQCLLYSLVLQFEVASTTVAYYIIIGINLSIDKCSFLNMIWAWTFTTVADLSTVNIGVTPP